VLLLGGVNAACVNLRPPPPPQPLETAGNAPAQVWTARTGRRLTPPVIADGDVLYAAGVDRKVYAVDLNSGNIRWSTRLSGIVAGGVLASGDTLFVATSRPDGKVFALQRRTGKRIWRTSTGPIGAPLALVRGVLVAATQRGLLLGINPRTGQIAWRQRLGTSRVAPTAAGENVLVVATVDSLFRVVVADGKVTHRVPSPGTILSPWVRFQGGLVAGTTDSLVLSIRTDDLKQQWTARVDAPVLGSPAARGDTLFAVSRRGSVYQIVPRDTVSVQRIAELRWPVTAPVTLVGDRILLGGADGSVRALRTDGREVWRVQLWRPVEVAPVPLADGLLAIGGDGDLHRYRQ
jgi:outer membrane protein assembly factor BamB